MSEASNLLLVCGFPGGGTDLTKTVLNAHPLVYLNGEMPLLYQLPRYQVAPGVTLDTPQALENLRETLRKLNTWINLENIEADFTTILAGGSSLTLEQALKLFFSSRERVIWGNKTPQNTEHITELADLFPGARFLLVTRDVRDICLSWHNKWGKDMLWCAAKWNERMQSGWEALQDLSPERWMVLKYERLLEDTLAACQDITSFLGLEFSTRMLEHYKYTSESIDGKLNYGKPIIASNRRKWMELLPQATTRRIEEIAWPSMQLFHYTPAYANQFSPLRGTEKLSGYANDLIAMTLIGNRAARNNNLFARLGELFHEFRKRV